MTRASNSSYLPLPATTTCLPPSLHPWTSPSLVAHAVPLCLGHGKFPFTWKLSLVFMVDKPLLPRMAIFRSSGKGMSWHLCFLPLCNIHHSYDALWTCHLPCWARSSAMAGTTSLWYPQFLQYHPTGEQSIPVRWKNEHSAVQRNGS